MNKVKTVVMSLPGSRHIAKGIMSELALPPECFKEVDFTTFRGGELYVRAIHEDKGFLWGKDVIIAASIHDHTDLIWLCALQDLVVNKQAKRLFIAMPYLAYQTQEREVHPNDAVMARVVATILCAGAGAAWNISRLIMDPHTEGAPNYFPSGLVPDVVQGRTVLTPIIRELEEDLEMLVMASADLGRPKWIENYARDLGIGFALANKHRTGEHTETTHFVGGEFMGKRVVLYDDLTRSGSSAIKALQLYVDHGASGGYLVLSHLAANSEDALRLLADSPFIKIIVTDSHRWSQHPIVTDSEKFVVVPLAERIACRIREQFATN